MYAKYCILKRGIVSLFFLKKVWCEIVYNVCEKKRKSVFFAAKKVCNYKK